MHFNKPVIFHEKAQTNKREGGRDVKHPGQGQLAPHVLYFQNNETMKYYTINK